MEPDRPFVRCKKKMSLMSNCGNAICCTCINNTIY